MGISRSGNKLGALILIGDLRFAALLGVAGLTGSGTFASGWTAAFDFVATVN